MRNTNKEKDPLDELTTQHQYITNNKEMSQFAPKHF